MSRPHHHCLSFAENFSKTLFLFLASVKRHLHRCKNSTRQSTHANFIFQTVLLMLEIIYLTML